MNGYNLHNYTKGNLVSTAYRTRYTDSWNFKYYRYDVRGRVIKLWNIISGFDTLVTDYSYNSQDQITNYSHTGKEESKTYKNNYDYNGRLQKTEFYNGPPDSPHPDITNLTEYEYNKNSQVSVQKFNDNSMDNEYTYNKRNWISTMSNSLKFLNYENTYFRNGNVKSMFIGGDYNLNFASSSDFTFNYQYDMSNRLTATNNPSKNFDMVNTYDKDGNILTLNRNGSSGNLLDGFNYVYYSGTNKLQIVSGSGTQYTYDANGNMTSDKLNKNDSIKYDYRNLILELVHTKYILNDSLIVKTKYFYDEAGNRIRKMSYNTSNNSLENDEVYSRDVSGRELAIYENNDILEYPTYGLDMIGKIKDNVLFFYLKDHLGSVRATVQDNKIISAQDYACPPWRDAWGYILEGRTYESNESKFKFTGKERDKENSYDYFGARYYDARIGRWNSVDPMYDKSVSLTPYQYAKLNPLLYIDPNGLDEFKLFVRTYISTEYSFNFQGDNRGTEAYPKSYRTEQIITVETNPNISSNPKINESGKTGITIAYYIDINGNPAIETGRAVGEFTSNVMRGYENSGDNALITFSGSAADPLVPFGLAPPATYNLSIQIIPNSGGATVKILGGGRSKYPSLEIYVENSSGVRQLIENYPDEAGFLAPFQLYNPTYVEPSEKNIK